MTIPPRIPLRTLFLHAAALLFAVHGFAQGTPELLKQGQAAFLRGDLSTAKQHFESVYQIDPRNTVAIAYLRRIKAAQANKAAQTPSREKEFAAMILPKVAFRQVALGDVLEALRQQCARLYPEKAPVSFVLPEEKLASAQITLNLAQIPLTEALRYAAELAHATVTYEPYAIVIRPGSAGAPPAQPPGAAPQQGAAPQ